MTPAAHDGSVGSHNKAPTITSDPRGSFTSADRHASCSPRNFASRSLSGPDPKSGPPLITTRVGSPPVCESTTCTRWLSDFIFSLISREVSHRNWHAEQTRDDARGVPQVSPTYLLQVSGIIVWIIRIRRIRTASPHSGRNWN